MASTRSKIIRACSLLPTTLFQAPNSNTKYCKRILEEYKLWGSGSGSGWHRMYSADPGSRIFNFITPRQQQQHRFFHAHNQNENTNTEIVKNAVASSSILDMRELERPLSELSWKELIDILFYLSPQSDETVDFISKYGPYTGPTVEEAHSRFCAGESFWDLPPVLHRMRELGLKGILNYCAEDVEYSTDADSNLKNFLDTVSSMSLLPPGSVSFVSVKMTALCNSLLLGSVSDLLTWQHHHPEFNLPWKKETLPILAPYSHDLYNNSSPETLTPNEQVDLNLAEERLFQLCAACQAVSLPLVVEAECTCYQAAIDYLVYRSFSEFNRSPGKPVVYWTVQAYLRDSLPRLIHASQEAKKRGVAMGVNLVRGTYKETEEGGYGVLSLRNEKRAPFPLHSLQTETDSCYNTCGSLLLNKVATGEASLVLATHNLESAKMAAVKAEELGIAKREGGLHFAQLKGIADSLSLSLCEAGFNVSKYIPFGAVDKATNYCLRRIDEYRGNILQNHSDMKPIIEELERRRQKI